MAMPVQSSSAQPSVMEWLMTCGDVTKEGKKAIGDRADIDAVLQLLLEKELAADAVRVVAAALPPREGVWWAWAAATHATRLATAEENTEGATSALAATERWIAAPDDETRRVAFATAELAGIDTPAGSAACAAFFATGSIAPASVGAIPGPPAMHTKMISLAVVLSAAADIPHYDALARAYLAQGLEVVKQVGGWNRSIELAKAHFDVQSEAQQEAKAAAPAQDSTSAPR